jgi:endonuclease YncB( thermonuclease family)
LFYVYSKYHPKTKSKSYLVDNMSQEQQPSAATTTTPSAPLTLDDCTVDNCPVFNFANEVKECKVVDVYDGDTCKVCFAMGGGFYKFAVRMLGYNTHEMKQKRDDPQAASNKASAIAARDYLRGLVLGKRVFIQCQEQDKYGRILGRIYLDHTLAPSVCVNDMMLTSGHGFAYSGIGDKFGGTQHMIMPSQ